MNITGRLDAGRPDYSAIVKTLASRAQDLGVYGCFSFSALFDRIGKGRERRTMVHFVRHPDEGWVTVSSYVDDCGDLPETAALCADAMVDVGFGRSQLKYDPSQSRQIENKVRLTQIKCKQDTLGPGVADQLFGIMNRVGVDQIHTFSWSAKNFGIADRNDRGAELYDQIVKEAFVADRFEVYIQSQLLAVSGLRVCRAFSGGSEHGLFAELGTFKRGRKKGRVSIHAAAEGYRVVFNLGGVSPEEELSQWEHRLGKKLEIVWLPNRPRR